MILPVSTINYGNGFTMINSLRKEEGSISCRGKQGLRTDTLMITERGTLMENKNVQIVHLQMVKDDEIVYGNRRMENPREAAELMKDFFGDVDRECLVVCETDVKMKPVYIQTVAMGSVSCCPVSIPDIFKAALLANALNLFLFHNHLSGDVTPSRDDLLMTRLVRKSEKLLGIHLQDHIILGNHGAF